MQEKGHKMLAYFDCFSGISGDMTLGAFIDLGVPVQWLTDGLKKILLSDFDLSVKTVSVHGIRAKRVRINVTTPSESRDYSQIQSLIRNSTLPQKVKDLSLEIFDKLASAESAIHGCPMEKVHFHEVGGDDAIADIVGTAFCVEFLDIESIVASNIPLGSGFVASRHGTLPVPAPATLAILKGVPVYGTDIPFELVTPTGAAIISSLAGSFGEMPAMAVKGIGYGAGTRDLEAVPNLLRIVTGREVDEKNGSQAGLEKDTVVVLETCIDDMNPELIGYTMDRLFEDGALDVWMIPVFMKKNRPGTMLQVLCRDQQKDVAIRRILTETSSLGVRFYEARRQTLIRESIFVQTSFGKVGVKCVKGPAGEVRIVPEYEICKKIAMRKQIPIRIVYETILKEAQAGWNK